jgi:hypothetical protein
MEKHTSTFSQAMDYLVECMRHEAQSASGFFLTVAIALVLGGLCWFLATQYTKLWNLRYNATFTLHILCAIAAGMTVLFTIAFVSLDYAKEIARERLNKWHESILADTPFLNATYADAYYRVKRQGVERFDPILNPPPSNIKKSTFPLGHPQTLLFVGKLYADASLAHFRKTNPFLSRIIMPGNTDVPAPVITADMNKYFAAHRGEKAPEYQLWHGVDIAAALFQKNLESQTSKVVTKARRWITMLFLLVQLIPFGLIGYSAYMDLQSST